MISVFLLQVARGEVQFKRKTKNDGSCYFTVLLLLRVYMMESRTSIISIISSCSSSGRLQGASWLLTSYLILLLTVSNVAIADEDAEECEYDMILIFYAVYCTRLEMLLGIM